MSTILICRFHLDLQRRNDHPNTKTTWSLPPVSIGSFHVATRKMHDAVMAEFGNVRTEEIFGTETSRREVVIPDVPAERTENDIGLVDIRPLPQDSDNAVEA